MAIKLPKRYAGRFAVELRPSGNSGWIDDKRKGTAQSFVCYGDPGQFSTFAAFDNPGALPKPVRGSIHAYCQKRRRRQSAR